MLINKIKKRKNGTTYSTQLAKHNSDLDNGNWHSTMPRIKEKLIKIGMEPNQPGVVCSVYV